MKFKLNRVFYSPETGSGGGSSFPSFEQFNEFLESERGTAATPTEETTPVAKETPEIPAHSNEEQIETPQVKIHKLKVDGVERDFTEAELYENASKGLDYTKKTQELAEERKAVAKMKEFVDYVQSQPVLADKMARLIDDFEKGDISQKQLDKGIDKLQDQVPVKETAAPDISEHPDFLAMKEKMAKFDEFQAQQDLQAQQKAIDEEKASVLK
jgi:hypothetical protein